MQVHNNTRKKALGAFYTHNGLTDVICEWAIAASDEDIFEPSFGGCGFLRSARDRLVSFGADAPNKQIYGCDIDPDAFGHLANLLEGPVDLTRFYKGDFLHQHFPEAWHGKFDAVIGNPPYLPYRKIDPAARDVALTVLAKEGLKLDKRASLWAYFVALSVRYVKDGGRMAWVLPNSFLYANYSQNLRNYIANAFNNVRAFELQERQFLLEGTEEKTVVLLAEGKLPRLVRQPDLKLPLSRCSGVRELSIQIKKWVEGELETSSDCGTSVFDNLPMTARESYLFLKRSRYYQQLGDQLKVQIGLVTGDNKFFLRNDEERKSAGLSVEDLVPVLPRFIYATGLDFRTNDFEILVQEGGKGYLVSCCEDKPKPTQVQRYLSAYPQDKRNTCSTFKKRATWSQTDDGLVPDAFFPVMQHNGPRLLLNNARVNCTNSVHRVYFKNANSEATKQLLALTTLSTFSQLSAEFCGRSYGSGALKHEPREVERVGILVPPIHHKKVSTSYRNADKCLRSGNADEARQIADKLILGAMGLDDLSTHISVLRSGLIQVRKHRQR
ncbi:Eco57I restriction-modification methylase domain-containing protein [Paracoccus sp. T5]|uniref:Eco57I restriction-modification methylase domain-containing protein n=1 Tax=Paracoccus sp. T5 TaxID=3402161 RepID=UPI003AE144A9